MADMFDEVDEGPGAPVEALESEANGLAALTRSELVERAKAVVGDRMELAVREVRSFAAVLFPELGPTTLRLALVFGSDPGDQRFIVTSSRDAYTRAREVGMPVFVMREFVALAHAAQNDRMPQHVLVGVLARKEASPSWVLSPEEAFGGMPLANAEPLSCTLGDAFDAMGARLVSVEVHGT